MREQLIQYVELLFAGAGDCEEIKQEILQNTLDRYDDLITEGKVPEAAYRLAITGIGDINEILGIRQQTGNAIYTVPAETKKQDNDTPQKKLMRAIGVGLYIICCMPLFILSEFGLETVGLCGMLAIVAIATVLMILGAKKDPKEVKQENIADQSPRQELQKSISSLIWAIGLAVYFILSFMTNAWHITWLCFPIIGAVRGLTKAIMDLKEADQYEN